MLVSTGERVTMALLSIAIQARGLEAISFTGSQCGIITNDQHFDARIIEVRPHRIEDELSRGCVVIVAGYQGMSYKREITTLGRGGSDTTAVALAAALDAERCEIYSDVDGVYSADPRVVPEAEHLDELDYEMLQEMAECGAQVLCAQAVEWARKAGVAIYARSTFDAVTEQPAQTLVRKHGPADQPRARAVVGDREVVLAQLPRAAGAEGLAAVLQVIDSSGVRYRELSTDSRGSSLVLSVTNAPQWQTTRSEIERQAPGIELCEDVAQISVTGGGINDDGDRQASFRRLLEEMGAEPRWLTATALRLSAIIPEALLEQAQQRLHAAFVAEE